MGEKTSAARVPASKARGNLARILDAVRVEDERVILTQHGREVAALIRVEDLHLLEELEDHADAEEIRRRISRSTGTVSLNELEAEIRGSGGARRRGK